MSDYLPPSGPPPPRVPEGWKAVWNEQYKEWFYVNIHTKASQWDLPTAPVYPSSEAPPGGAPPGYAGSGVSGPEKSGLGSNNPYSHNKPGTSSSNVDEDARLAAKLQEEENARTSGRPVSGGGAQGDYYNQQGQYGQQPGMGSSSYDQNQLPPREDKKKGLGGLIGKLTGKSGGHHGQPGYGGGGYGGQPQYGGYPQQGYPPQGAYGGGYGHGGYGGGGGGGYGPPPRRQGGGLGMGGAAALGVGGGLLGGALLAQGMDGGDGGGDYGGGGDDGGGGDYGGGDGGGGDGGGGD